MEGSRTQQLALLFGGQRCAGLEVARHRGEHLGAPGEVLQELARQLDRIPGHAIDAGDARIADPREHVMQPVSELVEHRHHVIVREQRRLAGRRGQEIAHQVGDGHGVLGAEVLAADAVVHPRAGALLRARAGIQIETGPRFAAGVDDLEEARVGVIHGHALSLDDSHAEQLLRDREQSFEHARQREVGAQLFLRDGKQLGLQLLRVVTHVPGIQRPAGEFFELGEFGLRGRDAPRAPAGAGNRTRPGWTAPCASPARRPRSSENPAGALPRGAARGSSPSLRCCRISGRSGRDRRRASTTLRRKSRRRVSESRVGHHGDVGGLLEREQPALDAFFGGAHTRLLDDAGIDPGELALIGDQVSPRVHRVEHVFFEFGAKLRELLHHGLVARLALRQAGRRPPAGNPRARAR